MSSITDKYARAAERWAEHTYADPVTYLTRRVELALSLGPALEPGDEILDLACGDATGAELFLSRGLRYRGVDATPEMVAAARRRLGERIVVEEGDVNEYVPPAPVAATTVFRGIMFVRDRRAFFRRAAGFTEKKLVFDVNPRQFPLDDIVAELRDSGLDRIAARPFFVPTAVALPRPLLRAARALERSGPLARLALRFRFTYLVAASRSSSA